MKRVNVKVLLALVAAVVLAVVAVVAVRNFQLVRNAGSLMTLARERLAEGKQNEALQYLQRYVGLRPGDDAAYAELADLLLERLKSREPTRAELIRTYHVLETAVRRNPKNDALRAKLAQFLLLIGRFSDARDHLEVLRTGTTGATDPPPDKPGQTADKPPQDLTNPQQIRLMLAQAYRGMGEFERSAGLAAECVGYDLEHRAFVDQPNPQASSDAFLLLAAALDDTFDDKEAAADVLARLVESKPDDALAWRALARWQRDRGDAKTAAATAERAVKLAPDDPATVFDAFELARETGDVPRAQELIQQAAEKFPGDRRGYLGLANLHLQQGRTEDAETVLRAGIDKLPEDGSIPLMLADVLLQRDQLAEAEDMVTRAKEQLGRMNPAVGLFEARMLIGQKQWVQAKQRLQEVRPLAVGSTDLTRQIDLYLGRCAEQLGEYDVQLEANRRVLIQNPNFMPARVGAASALVAAGKSEEALAEFESIAAVVPLDKLAEAPQIWLPLLQLRIEAQSRQPVESRDWSKIDALLEAIQQVPSVSPSQVALLRADVLLRKGEFEAAEAVLAKAGEGEPTNAQVAAARTTLALQRQGAAAARELLRTLPAETAGHPAVLAVDARVATAEGGAAAREALARIAERGRLLPDAEASQILSQLAGLSFGLGDREVAERLWTEAAEKQPAEVAPRMYLFDMALESGDVEKAAAAAVALAQVAGETSPQAHVAEAAAKILAVRKSLFERQDPSERMPEPTADEKKTLDTARGLLIEAENARPGWSRTQVLFAEMEGLEGDTEKAIDRLQRALDLGATNPAVVRQLVAMLYATNRIEEARQALARLGPEAAGLERLSAEVEMRAGKFEDAVALAEKSVKADSTNADALLWLGQLLERSGKRDQALQTVARAVEAAPDRASTWLTLMSLQLSQGKRKAAEQTLDRAAGNLAEPERSLALAQGNEMLGRIDAAARLYGEAVAAAADDMRIRRQNAEFLLRAGRLGPAREALQALLTMPANSREELATQSWARRAVAKVLADQGTFRGLQAALQALRENADANGKIEPEDLALQARLLASRVEPENWREAIKALETLAASQPLETGQRLQLSELHERLGDWEEARRELFAISSSPDAPPAILALVIEKLLAHGERDTARSLHRRLQKISPDGPLALALEAKLALAEGNREQAVAAARRLMPEGDPTPDQAEQLGTLAQLFEELGFPKAADKVLGKMAGVSADGILARAAFLGRQRQAAAALDLLEKSWDKMPLERLMRVALEVVRDADDPAIAARLDPWFTRAIRQDPESLTLPLLLAELRDFQGRAQEVETIYRELLTRERLEPLQAAIVTNNLAFHLARPDTAAEARTLVESAIQELGPHPDLLDTRGMVSLAAGDARQAVADMQEAALQPTPTKLLHLAFAQLQAGDVEGASRSLEDAKKKNLRPARLSAADRERLTAVEAALNRPAD